MLTNSERITILTRRLENLRTKTDSEMSTDERVEAIRETQAALQYAVETQARADALR